MAHRTVFATVLSQGELMGPRDPEAHYYIPPAVMAWIRTLESMSQRALPQEYSNALDRRPNAILDFMSARDAVAAPVVNFDASGHSGTAVSGSGSTSLGESIVPSALTSHTGEGNRIHGGNGAVNTATLSSDLTTLAHKDLSGTESGKIAVSAVGASLTKGMTVTDDLSSATAPLGSTKENVAPNATTTGMLARAPDKIHQKPLSNAARVSSAHAEMETVAPMMARALTKVDHDIE